MSGPSTSWRTGSSVSCGSSRRRSRDTGCCARRRSYALRPAFVSITCRDGPRDPAHHAGRDRRTESERRPGAFQEVAEALHAASIIGQKDCPAIRDAFLARERRAHRARLGHGRAARLLRQGAFGAPRRRASRRGVQMKSPDGKPIRLFFCLVACELRSRRVPPHPRDVAKVARDSYWRRYLEKVATGDADLRCPDPGEKALSV